jgi:hypothetical protein
MSIMFEYLVAIPQCSHTEGVCMYVRLYVQSLNLLQHKGTKKIREINYSVHSIDTWTQDVK